MTRIVIDLPTLDPQSAERLRSGAQRFVQGFASRMPEVLQATVTVDDERIAWKLNIEMAYGDGETPSRPGHLLYPNAAALEAGQAEALAWLAERSLGDAVEVYQKGRSAPGFIRGGKRGPRPQGR